MFPSDNVPTDTVGIKYHLLSGIYLQMFTLANCTDIHRLHPSRRKSIQRTGMLHYGELNTQDVELKVLTVRIERK